MPSVNLSIMVCSQFKPLFSLKNEREFKRSSVFVDFHILALFPQRIVGINNENQHSVQHQIKTQLVVRSRLHLNNMGSHLLFFVREGQLQLA